MKKSIDGFTWIDEKKNGTIDIGFTKQFIEEVLGECFHVTQSTAALVVENKPLLTLETMVGLKVIKSPITGTVTFFNTKARDFPDRITEDDVVASIRPKGVEVTKTKSKTVDNYTVQGAWLETPQQTLDFNRQWFHDELERIRGQQRGDR